MLKKDKVIFTDYRGRIWTEDALNKMIKTLCVAGEALERVSWYREKFKD